jgi:hypothetical protein
MVNSVKNITVPRIRISAIGVLNANISVQVDIGDPVLADSQMLHVRRSNRRDGRDCLDEVDGHCCTSAVTGGLDNGGCWPEHTLTMSSIVVIDVSAFVNGETSERRESETRLVALR